MKLIVVEGARGVGKSTYVQELRNIIPSTMVMQLTGMNKTENEFVNIHEHYCNMMSFLEDEKDMPYNLVMDRFFFSEYVMSKLYKDYNFCMSANQFSKRLAESGIEVVLVLLTLEGNAADSIEEIFQERLQRPDKVQYQNLKYEAEASVKEQELYKVFIHKFKEQYNDYKNIKVLELCNDTSYKDEVFNNNINKIIEAIK
jgi:thymidylate kinase